MAMDHFGSTEALMEFFREKADDIDAVEITVAEASLPSNPRMHVAAIVRCVGQDMAIGQQDAEALINGELLKKLRIPIRLRREGDPPAATGGDK
jgi:hypothetical protein